MVRRLGVLGGCVLGLVLLSGAAQAAAAGATKVLIFDDSVATVTGIGFNPDSNSPPPIGGHEVIALVLKNHGSQFGKPSGTAVGHVVIDCTVLSVGPRSADGVCSGIAHVPNGYFTFGGDGVFQDSSKPNYWAVTGGVGAYANSRGQIKVINHSNGTSTATVTLSS